MTRKSFVLHADSLNILDELSNEQAGLLFKAIKAHQLNESIELDMLTRVAINPFINQFDRDNQKYQTTVERNKVNGLKGGRPSKPKVTQGNPNKPSGLNGFPEEPKKADSVSVSVNDSDNDSKSVIKEKDLSPKVNANLFLINEIFQHWVITMNKSPRTSLTSLRKSKIDSRLKDGYPVHEIKQAIDNVAKDQFLVAGGHTDIEMICRSDTNLEKYRDAMPISKSDIKMSKHNQDIEEFSRGTQS